MKNILKGRLRSSKLPSSLGETFSGFPADKLDRSLVTMEENWLLGHSGIPVNADSLAYEPIQRLLAVGTADGRVKLVGKPGVERTLYSSENENEGTQQLMFLYNRGVILRVSKAGFIDVWPVESAKNSNVSQPFSVLKIRDDKVTYVAPLARDPYVVLGCLSGSLHFAAAVGSSGATISEARHVRALKLLPSKVTAKELEATGEVQSLAAKSSGPYHRVLCLHSKSGVVVWDLRARCRVTAVAPHKSGVAAVRGAGPVTATCWASLELPQKHAFATGHHTGSIFLWTFPAKQEVFSAASLECTLNICDDTHAGIRSLTFVAGTSPYLLVLGGQSSDQPDSLSRLQLQIPPAEQQADAADVVEQPRPKRMPWFGTILGFAIVPQQGSITGCDNPSAIIMVMEGGQLLVYDLQDEQPINFTLPFQSLPAPTITGCFSIPCTRIPGAPVNGMTAELLRKCAESVQGEKGSSRDTEPWAWVLSGGEVPQQESCLCSTVYCTGHADGVVRVWDQFTEMPSLASVAPSQAASSLKKSDVLRPVSAIELCWQAGLLAVGHERGDVRLYQLSDKPRSTECVMFESVGPRSANPSIQVSEAPGFQLRMRVSVHLADVTCLAMCGNARLLAIGDKSGAVSLLDISKPELLWYQLPCQQPLFSLAICNTYLPASKDRNDVPGLQDGAVSRVLFVAASDSTVTSLELKTGFHVGKNGWMKPKSTSQTVLMALLDWEGGLVSLVGDPSVPSSGQGFTTASSMESRGEVRSPTGLQAQAQSRLATSRSFDTTSMSKSDSHTISRVATADEDLDMEALLAAAAAQVDAASKGRPAPVATKPKSTLGSQRSASVEDLSDDDSLTLRATGRPQQERKQALAPQSSIPRARSYEDSPTSPREADSDAGGSGPASPSRPTEGTAVFVLLVTAECLRLYSCIDVMCGERTTHKKVKLSTPPVWAKVVHVDGAPGLLVMTNPEDPQLQIYTLPGLEVVADVVLSSVLPWRWQWDPSQLSRVPRLVACTHTGHMTLLGPAAEVAHLRIAACLPQLSQAASMYDWDLAAAAHAAKLCATEQQALAAAPGRRRDHGERTTSPRPISPRPNSPLQEGTAEGSSGLAEGHHKAGHGLHSVIRKVTSKMTTGVNQMAKGVKKVVDKVDHDLTKLMHLGPEVEAAPPYAHPPLADVLNCRAQAVASSDEEEYEAVEAPLSNLSAASAGSLATSSASEARAASRTTSMPRAQGRPSRPTEELALDGREARERAELLAGTASPTASSRARTADEIKAKYGRPTAATKRAGEVSAVMAENVQKLGERGEKLSQLQEKSNALEESAQGFAAMARQLAQQQKNKKWWQL